MNYKNYVNMARPDHWPKNIFMLPGVAVAYLETDISVIQFLLPFMLGVSATCLVASANYVINEFLDSKFDRFHPSKKNRPAVRENISGKVVFLEYVGLMVAGFGLASFINTKFMMTLTFLGICGLLYNVKPFRLKDLVYVDVLFESINNVVRLLLGWFVVTETLVPPLSLMISFWMAGAFLMASKRFAEYRQIGDPELAGKYRRSFCFYSERSLLMSSIFYAITFAFMFGIFLFKYRIEYILTFPMFSALFVWYLGIAMKPHSTAQNPEKLYKDGWLMVFICGIVMTFLLLSIVDIPILKIILQSEYYG